MLRHYGHEFLDNTVFAVESKIIGDPSLGLLVCLHVVDHVKSTVECVIAAAEQFPAETVTVV